MDTKQINEIQKYVQGQGLGLSFEQIFRNYNLSEITIEEAKDLVDTAAKGIVESELA